LRVRQERALLTLCISG